MRYENARSSLYLEYIIFISFILECALRFCVQKHKIIFTYVDNSFIHIMLWIYADDCKVIGKPSSQLNDGAFLLYRGLTQNWVRISLSLGVQPLKLKPM